MARSDPKTTKNFCGVGSAHKMANGHIPKLKDVNKVSHNADDKSIKRKTLLKETSSRRNIQDRLKTGNQKNVSTIMTT